MYYQYLPLLLLLIVCGTAVATKDFLLLENDPTPPAAAEKKKSSKEKESKQEAHQDPEAERTKLAKEKEAKMTELFFKFQKNSGACIENFLTLMNKHMGADERAHWGAEITPEDKETNFSFFSTFRKNFFFDHDENRPKLKKFDMHQDLRFKLFLFEAFRYSFTPNGHVLPKDMAKIALMLNWQEYIRFKTLPLTEDKWKKWKFIDYFTTDKRKDVYLCDLLSISVSHSSKKNEKREDEIKRMDSRAPSSSYSTSHSSYSHRQGSSLHGGQSQRIPEAAGSAAGKFGSISLRSEFRKMFIKESSNLNKTKLNSILSRWQTVDRYKYWNGICSKNGKLDISYGHLRKELILKTFQKFAGNFMSKQGFQVYQHMRKYFNDEEWPIVKNIIYPALEFYIHRGQQLFDAATLSEFPLLLLICLEQWGENKGELSLSLLETKLTNEKESKNKAKKERQKIESLNAHQKMLPNVGMAWQEAADPNNGRKYYFNSITRESTWAPPNTKEVWQELTVPQDGPAGFRAHPSDGRKYYSNLITKESTWTPHKISEVWQGIEEENDGQKFYLNSLTGEKTSTPPGPVANEHCNQSSFATGPEVDEAWRELAVPNGGGNKFFYFNSITRESTWTKPAALLEKEEKQYLYTYAVENFKPAWLEEPIVTQQQGGEFYRLHFYEFNRLESSLFFVPVHQMDHHHVQIMLDAQKYWSDWSWPDVKAVKPKAIGGLFDQPFLDALIAAKTAGIFRFKYSNKKGKWHFHINEDYIRGFGAAGTIPAAHGHGHIPEYRYSVEYMGYSNYAIVDNANDVINGSFGQWLYQAWNAAEINKTKPLKFGVEILSRIFRRLLNIDETMPYYQKNSQHLHQNQRLNFNFDALFDWVARMLAQCLALNETSIKEEEGREKQEQHCVVDEKGNNKSLLDKNLLFEKMKNINGAPKKHSSSRSSSSAYFAMLANSDACIERFDIFRNLWFFDVDKRFRTNFGQDLLNTIEIYGKTTCNFKMAHQIEAMFGSLPKRSGQPMKELLAELKKFLGSDVCKEFFGTVDTKVWMHAEGRMEMLFAALASRRNDNEHVIGDEKGKHLKLGQYEVKQSSVTQLAGYILLSAIYYLNRLLRETLLEDSLNGTRKFLAIEMNWEEEGRKGVVKHEGNESTKQVHHNTINGFKMLEHLKEKLSQLKEHIRFLNERQREQRDLYRDRYNRDYNEDRRVKVNALRAIALKPNLLNAIGKSIIDPTLSDVATWMERVQIAEQRLNNVFIKMSKMAKKMKIKKIAKKLMKIEKKKGKKGKKHKKKRERTELAALEESSSSSSEEEGIFGEEEEMEEINWDQIFPEDYSGNGGFFALFNENIDDNSVGDPLFTLFNAKDDGRAETIYYAMDAFYRIGELALGGDGDSGGVADAFGNFVNGIFDDSTANAHMFGSFLAGNVGDLTSGMDLSNALSSFDGSSAMTNVDWGNMLDGFGAVIKGIFSDVGNDVGDAFGAALKGLGNFWESLTTSDSSSSSNYSSYTSSSNWSAPSSSGDSDWLSGLFD